MLDAQQGKLPRSASSSPSAPNEHPGYASEQNGSEHFVDLIKTILNGPNDRDTR